MQRFIGHIHHLGRRIIAIVVIVALHMALLAFVFTRSDALLPATTRPLPAVAIQLLREPGSPGATQAHVATHAAPASPVTQQAQQQRAPHDVSVPTHARPHARAIASSSPPVSVMPSPTALPHATAITSASPPGAGLGRGAEKTSGASDAGTSATGMASGAPKNVAHVDCHIARPAYRDSDESGTVDVRFIVEPTGKISHAEIRRSSGIRSLDDAALAATRQGVCRPWIENGKAMRVTATQPFRFGGEED
jgi:protein TonB